MRKKSNGSQPHEQASTKVGFIFYDFEVRGRRGCGRTKKLKSNVESFYGLETGRFDCKRLTSHGGIERQRNIKMELNSEKKRNVVAKEVTECGYRVRTGRRGRSVWAKIKSYLLEEQ